MIILYFIKNCKIVGNLIKVLITIYPTYKIILKVRYRWIYWYFWNYCSDLWPINESRVRIYRENHTVPITVMFVISTKK